MKDATMLKKSVTFKKECMLHVKGTVTRKINKAFLIYSNKIQSKYDHN